METLEAKTRPTGNRVIELYAICRVLSNSKVEIAEHRDKAAKIYATEADGLAALRKMKGDGWKLETIWLAEKIIVE